MTPEQVRDAALASPPATVIGLKIFGVSLPDWAAIVAIIYTLLMIAEFCVRKYRYYFTRQDRREDDGQQG